MVQTIKRSSQFAKHQHVYFIIIGNRHVRGPAAGTRCTTSSHQSLPLMVLSISCLSVQADVCFTQHMACILLTNMDPPVHGPAAHLHPATGVDSKQDADATCLTVHLYYVGKDGGGGNGSESVLTFPPGEYVAEELCISAAKACGKSKEDFSLPVCKL